MGCTQSFEPSLDVTQPEADALFPDGIPPPPPPALDPCARLIKEAEITDLIADRRSR